MKKEIREIKEGVLQITTLDERWYSKQVLSPVSGLPEIKFYPSSTWIASFYPKGIGFYKWLAQKGWDEAEEIKIMAGSKGSKVHRACSDIDEGKEISIEAKYLDPVTEKEEELTPEEYECVMSYRNWIDAVYSEVVANEITAFNEKWEYAGTIDKIFRMDKQIWIVDLKTGQSIWPEQELQISSYSHLEIDYKKLGITDEEWKNRKQAILQLGYHRNKNRYKWNEVEDKFNLFIMAKEIWKNENPNAKPKQASYPLILKSEVRTKQVGEKLKRAKNKKG